MKKLVLTIILTLTATLVFAQKGNTFIIIVGTGYYNGDYNKIQPFNPPSYAIGIGKTDVISPKTNMRWSAKFVNLQGANSQQNFSNNIMDIGGLFEFYLLKNKRFRRSKFAFKPYLLAGIKFLYIPQGKRTTNLAIPLGVGIKFYSSKTFGLALEWKTHITNSDELDFATENTSNTNFVSTTNDWYNFVGIVMNFTLGKQRKLGTCPAYF